MCRMENGNIMKKAAGWLPSRKPARNVLIFFCCPGFLIFRSNFWLLLLLVACVWRMRRMLAVSLIRLLPTQSYDNWINPALILFLLNIIIIAIIVLLAKFFIEYQIGRHHLSTSQENSKCWTTMIIWQKPGGPTSPSPSQRKSSNFVKLENDPWGSIT